MMQNKNIFIDGLVRQYLRTQQEDVDAEGMAKRVLKRRRRVLRFPGGRGGAIAAAALLLFVGVLALCMFHGEDRKQPARKRLALTPLEKAMRTEAYAVWGALTTVGEATLGASRQPVAELAKAGPQLYSFPDDAKRQLYALPGDARRWFDHQVKMVKDGSDHKRVSTQDEEEKE